MSCDHLTRRPPGAFVERYGDVPPLSPEQERERVQSLDRERHFYHLTVLDCALPEAIGLAERLLTLPAAKLKRFVNDVPSKGISARSVRNCLSSVCATLQELRPESNQGGPRERMVQLLLQLSLNTATMQNLQQQVKKRLELPCQAMQKRVAIMQEQQRQYVDVRNELAQANSRLVIHGAKRRKYKDKGLPFDDLVHEGMLGLMHAIEKFDIGMKCKLSTYAVPWIRHFLDSAVEEAQEKSHFWVAGLANVASIRQRLTHALSRKPRDEEILLALQLQGCDPKRATFFVQEAKRGWRGAETTMVGEDGQEAQIFEQIVCRDPGPEARVEKNEQLQRLHAALADLDPQQHMIIEESFGLGGNAQKTLRKIAALIGCSKVRARQRREEILKELRRILGA